VLAAVAQNERELISGRIRNVLAIVKQQQRDGTRPPGKKRLGPSPQAIRAIQAHGDRGRYLAVQSIQRKADVFAARLRPMLVKLRAEGVTTLRGLADALNHRQVLTPRRKPGLHWTPAGVGRLLDRLELRRKTNRFSHRLSVLQRNRARLDQRPGTILRERPDRPNPPRQRNKRKRAT